MLMFAFNSTGKTSGSVTVGSIIRANSKRKRGSSASAVAKCGASGAAALADKRMWHAVQLEGAESFRGERGWRTVNGNDASTQRRCTAQDGVKPESDAAVVQAEAARAQL